jgi:S-adenosyl methyltransferase
LPSNGHGGFGKRFGETGRLKDRYRAPNRLRGGKDNFEADRIAAEKVLALVPGLRRAAVENRRFLRRVVRFLAAEAGISQFLDIGVGLPTQGAVHEVVRELNPHARVV